MTGLEENKALVRRLYTELEAGNFDALDEIMAEDYVDHAPPPFPGLGPGRQGVKDAARVFLEATPGVHEIEDMVAEGDKVVTRMTAYGKHVGDLFGITATGNDIRMTATVIHRIEDGKLVEKWADKDVFGFLQQLGVIPARPSG